MLLRRLTSGSAMHGFGASHLLGRADRFLKRGTEANKLYRSVEVQGAAFTFGLIQGKYKKDGGLTLILPVDMLAGAAFHLLGLFGPSAWSSHCHAVADGALASFFTTTGYRVGERWGQGGSLMHGLSGMFGDKEPAGGSTIADKELANLVKAG